MYSGSKSMNSKPNGRYSVAPISQIGKQAQSCHVNCPQLCHQEVMCTEVKSWLVLKAQLFLIYHHSS